MGGTYPVAFSNSPRAPSVIFSEVLRSTLWPVFFATKSKACR
jgi:hypothetical protein